MIFSYLLNMQSHPSWVCGLKLKFILLVLILHKSHPSWVCGLKQYRQSAERNYLGSHPSWVCGLKPVATFLLPSERQVTPFVGVWIETVSCHQSGRRSRRHTLRGCVD